ncbi:unnamed protein product [Mytilus coruscus]|uniref:Peptidase C1A papain C-terminal domain-containing protein n=1 Tax=Mytilus coruscus TaxID=42192 RepID=A0A6J8AWN9_MYTCO|nr:unnamed protein product [Mytilus coruscus]
MIQVGNCRYTKSNIGATVTGYTGIRNGDENQLKQTLETVGPVSAWIFVDRNFMLYKRGVFNNPTCKSYTINHAFLVVGYGTQSNDDYWLVKNSYWTVRGSAIQEKRETRIEFEQSLMNCSSKYCKQKELLATSVLGGTSSINHMVYIRGSRYDYIQWERDGAVGWGYTDVLPYFLKIEDMKIVQLSNSTYNSTGGYLPITKSKITSLSNVYQRAAEELGYKVVDQNREDMIGFLYVQSNIFGGERFSTSTAYIRPIMNRSVPTLSLQRTQITPGETQGKNTHMQLREAMEEHKINFTYKILRTHKVTQEKIHISD